MFLADTSALVNDKIAKFSDMDLINGMFPCLKHHTKDLC